MEETLVGPQATEALGARIAQLSKERYAARALVFLVGDLGMGKTTLTRGLLRSLGYSDAVKSPTYTLLESYELADWQIFHFDLYRVADPLELEFVGIDEIIDGPGLKLIEWPERAADWLPAPDIQITLTLGDPVEGEPVLPQVDESQSIGTRQARVDLF